MLTRHPQGGYQHTADPGEPTTKVPRISVTDQEAALLAKYATGRTVLEIGTGLGVSTRALASTATSVTTVDVDPWVWETIWPALPANVTGAGWVPKDQRFDVVFIDGDHDADAVRADLALAESVLAPGGTILAHDTAHLPLAAALGEGWTHHDTRFGLSVKVYP